MMTVDRKARYDTTHTHMCVWKKKEENYICKQLNCLFVFIYTYK